MLDGENEENEQAECNCVACQKWRNTGNHVIDFFSMPPEAYNVLKAAHSELGSEIPGNDPNSVAVFAGYMVTEGIIAHKGHKAVKEYLKSLLNAM